VDERQEAVRIDRGLTTTARVVGAAPEARRLTLARTEAAEGVRVDAADAGAAIPEPLQVVSVGIALEMVQAPVRQRTSRIGLARIIGEELDARILE
jgi:hypothetical protein